MDNPAQPEEIAAVIASLLSDGASYLRGAVAVDGGMTAGFRTTDRDAVEHPVEVPRRDAPEAAA